jgi:hypothetical protein
MFIQFGCFYGLGDGEVRGSIGESLQLFCRRRIKKKVFKSLKRIPGD